MGCVISTLKILKTFKIFYTVQYTMASAVDSSLENTGECEGKSPIGSGESEFRPNGRIGFIAENCKLVDEEKRVYIPFLK